VSEGQKQPVMTQQGNEQKGKWLVGKGRFGRGGQPFKKPDPDAVSTLKFRPANNFTRFKKLYLRKH